MATERYSLEFYGLVSCSTIIIDGGQSSRAWEGGAAQVARVLHGRPAGRMAENERRRREEGEEESDRPPTGEHAYGRAREGS